MAKQPKITAASEFDRLAKFRKMYGSNPSPEQQRTLDGIERSAKSHLDTEMAAKAKSFLERNTGADWWELAKKQYPITETAGKFIVRSEARGWKEEKDWTFDYAYEAMAKIEKLVNWLNDNRKRGYGDRDADVERLSEKYAAKETV